jgi:hypothetical protein
MNGEFARVLAVLLIPGVFLGPLAVLVFTNRRRPEDPAQPERNLSGAPDDAPPLPSSRKGLRARR